jgi:Secretion system C-terminal sorting domain
VKIKIVSVETNADAINSFTLFQNYPNPFNPTTVISFSIPKSDFVTSDVYNIIGQKVGGTYNVNYNAPHLSNGIYLYRIIMEGLPR